MKKETAKNIANIIGCAVGMAAEFSAGVILSRLCPITRTTNTLQRVSRFVGLTGINFSIGCIVTTTVSNAVLTIFDGIEETKEFIEETVKGAMHIQSPSKMFTDCIDENDISEECDMDEDDTDEDDTDEDETVENVCIEFGKYYSEKLAIMMLSSFTGNQNGYLMYDVDTGTLRHSADMNDKSPSIIYWDVEKINNIAHVAHRDDGWTVVIPKPINYKTWKLATRLPCKKKGDDA